MRRVFLTTEKIMKYIATSVVAMLLLSGCDNTQSNNSSPSETEVGVVTLKSQPVSVVSELTGRTSAALSAEVRPQVGELSRNAYLRKVIWSRLDSLSTRLMRPVIRLHGMKPGSITTSTGTGKSRLPESAALYPTGERERCFTTGC